MELNGNEAVYVSKDEKQALMSDEEHYDQVDFQPTFETQMSMAETYWSKITLALVVTVCCCPILGVIAFGFAGMAEGTKYQNGVRARRLARISKYLSIAGIITGVLVIASLIAVEVWFIGYFWQQVVAFVQHMESYRHDAPEHFTSDNVALPTTPGP